MTDKEKILELIEKRYEYWKEKEFNSHSIESEIRMSECQHLLLMINSLQEEPVSEDLEEVAMQYRTDEFPSLCNGCKHIPIDAFKAGAKWQKKKDEVANDKNFIEVKVKSDKDGLFTTETWDEMNELLQKIGAKAGDKVYISIIKQEEE